MEQHTKSREEAFEQQFRLQKLEKDRQANYLKAEKFQAIQQMELQCSEARHERDIAI